MVYPNLGNKTEKALAEFLGLQKGDPFPENYHRALMVSFGLEGFQSRRLSKIY
jgi:hypothetical protein